jgi:hypothetical protein
VPIKKKESTRWLESSAQTLKHRADDICVDVALHTDRRTTRKLNVDRARPSPCGDCIIVWFLRPLTGQTPGKQTYIGTAHEVRRGLKLAGVVQLAPEEHLVRVEPAFPSQ